jgi:hypothetical protein
VHISVCLPGRQAGRQSVGQFVWFSIVYTCGSLRFCCSLFLLSARFRCLFSTIPFLELYDTPIKKMVFAYERSSVKNMREVCSAYGRLMSLADRRPLARLEPCPFVHENALTQSAEMRVSLAAAENAVWHRVRCVCAFVSFFLLLLNAFARCSVCVCVCVCVCILRIRVPVCL